jgi:maleate isomerase
MNHTGHGPARLPARRRYHPTHRIGLLTPSANPAVEPELRHLLPGAVALHATRMPVMPGTTLEERNAAYLEAAEAALGDFGALPLDAVVIGITGPSYALAPGVDAALQERLSATAGRPVILAARAIAEALAALGRTRLLLFSPYPGWLTERAERYWRAAGLDLVESYKVSDTFRAYELTPEEVADGLARLSPPEDCAVLLSGTGMPTLDAMAWMRGRIGAPLLSSNLACAFAACRHLGLGAVPAMEDCCPALAARLPSD